VVAAAGARDPWLDNVKMVLVTVVVVGHAIVLVPLGEVQAQVYDFIYYWHIPAFVLVTGYLSRSFRWSRRHLLSVLTTLLVPYAIFEWLMATFRVHVVSEIDSVERMWLNPHWPMWYLVVLAMWRLLTPALRLHWVAVPLSVGVSLMAGIWNVELFDINRMLGLLPFFVAGLHLPASVLTAARARWSWLVGLVVLALVWRLAAVTDDYWSTQWLYYRTSYDELGEGTTDGAWDRLRLLGVAAAGSVAALSLVPRRRSFLSAMGASTLVVYLLHGFVIRLLEARGYADWMPDDEWATLAITVAFAVSLALLLAWPPVAGRLNALVDPVNTVLALRERGLRRRADERPGRGSGDRPSARPVPPGPGPRP
jgi:fucose 4-O-acetylase-like acetyltransferase